MSMGSMSVFLTKDVSEIFEKTNKIFIKHVPFLLCESGMITDYIVLGTNMYPRDHIANRKDTESFM